MPTHIDSVELLPDASWRQSFRRQLLRWFRRNARDLPWRHTKDPYAVWVSEIMLQQTQVVTVKSYFTRFLQRFPDIASLAAASDQEVLRYWEGLGYYRRGRSLHQAARKMMTEFQGKFPRDPQTVQELPGIGRYTAGAILSIAFDDRLPILETNSIRLLSRLLAYQGDTTRSAGQKLLWAFSEQLLPRRNVGSFNQALMEVGSCVCTPKNPDCANCPVRKLCRARSQELQEVIPVVKQKMKYQDLHEAAVVIRKSQKVLLRRCMTGERWEGLWDFPRCEISSQKDHLLRKEIEQKVRKLTGVTIHIGDSLATIKHGVTRFRITLECYEADVLASSRSQASSEQKWIPVSTLEDYPLSVTGRKISRLIAES